MKFRSLLIVLLCLAVAQGSARTAFDYPNIGKGIQLVELTSLGRVAYLGDLYDLRSDTFNQISIFNSGPPQESINSTENVWTDLQFIFDDRYSEKLDKLDVQANLRLSVLAGLVSMGGSGEYLKQTDTSTDSVSCSLVYYTKTVHERLNIFSKFLENIINHQVISMVDATHVVVGIQWGGNVVLDVQDQNTNSSNKETIAESIQVLLKKLAISLSGGSTTDITDEDNVESKKFGFRIFGDISFNSSLPDDIMSALEFMKQIPSLVMKPNHGKGVPIKYTLLPLKIVKDYYEIASKFDSNFVEIDKSVINQLVYFFDDIETIKPRYTSLFKQIEDIKILVNKSSYKEIKNFENKVITLEMNMIKKFSDTLVKVRSVESNTSNIFSILQDYQHNQYSYINSYGQLTLYTKYINKYLISGKILKSGANYITEEDDLDEILTKYSDQKLFIFYYVHSATKEQVDQFLTIVKDKKNAENIYYFTDNETRSDLNNDGELKLNLYLNGQLNREDILEDEYQATFTTYLIIYNTPGKYFNSGSFACNILTQDCIPISMNISNLARFIIMNDFMFALGKSSLITIN